MTKMSAKTQLVYDSIVSKVEYARNHTYEEWLGKTKDSCILRYLYEEQKSGLVHGFWDGRSLNALEKRGLIRYYDDMQKDDWCVWLIG